MTEGGDLGDRSRAADDHSGNIKDTQSDPSAGGADAGGVMTGTVSGDRTGSGLGGGTAPGGPLDLGGDGE